MASERHQLLRLYADFCDNVDPAQVVPYLISKGILNDTDLDKIKESNRRRYRVECLLDILIRSDPALSPMKHLKASLSGKYPSLASEIDVDEPKECHSCTETPVPCENVTPSTAVNVFIKRSHTTLEDVNGADYVVCQHSVPPVRKNATIWPISRPMNSIVIDDEMLLEVAERSFCTILDGDWLKLNALIDRLATDPNVDIVNQVRMAHVLRELLTRDKTRNVLDLIHACRHIAENASYTKYPTLHLAWAFSFEAWCLAHEACIMQQYDLKHTADGLREDSLALLEQAREYVQTLAPFHGTCWLYMTQAIVYLINYSSGESLNQDAAHRVNQINALSVEHFLLAEDNGSHLHDSIKRLSRIHLAGALLNFSTSSIVAGIPPPKGLDPPSDCKLKAAKTIISQIRRNLTGITRRCEAYFYLLSSTAELYSKQIPEAEGNLDHALSIMANVPGSGPKEAAVAKPWFESQKKWVMFG